MAANKGSPRLAAGLTRQDFNNLYTDAVAISLYTEHFDAIVLLLEIPAGAQRITQRHASRRGR